MWIGNRKEIRPSDKFWESSESDRKSSENRQKRRHEDVYNKKNITR